jgi:hypothetical protein
MRKAVELGRFRPFLVGGGNAPVSLLQYADDTLCIGEATIDNLWVLKATLRGFELASGLKVNFWKSCIIGVNVSEEFLGMASQFLNCRLGSVPFKYLGLPVGANPRKMSTWEPMLDTIQERLGAWRNKYVSIGGRIVLINLVLNAIPIFYLSYMKMPLSVWRKLVSIQRKFLRLVNLSLLAKWRWKLLFLDDEVWKEVVISRYGRDVVGKKSLGEHDITRLTSPWWRDVCLLEGPTHWFSTAVGRKVGCGDSTLFWEDQWTGTQTLRQRFPRLFGISSKKSEVIRNMGVLVDGRWRWNLEWR